jgi:HEPN domain-containing protein
MQDKQETIKYWVMTSKRDFKTAEILFLNKRYSHALFFCHLSIEKMLKAVFIARKNTAPPFIHDLVRLAEKTDIPLDESVRDRLVEINTFNIAARYDDIKLNFFKKANHKFAGEQLERTKGLLKWLRKKA